MNADEIVKALERMAENSRSKHDVLVASADLIESLQAEKETVYMDGIKKAIYEIMKETDIPGSNEIRNSGDTDDGMCAKVSERINAKLAASNRRERAAVELIGKVSQAVEVAFNATDYVKPNTGIWHTLGLALDWIKAWRGHQEDGKGDNNGNVC